MNNRETRGGAGDPAGRSPAQAGSVVRTALVERLRASSDVPVVLVVAGAGFGKTTLLRQWAAADGRPFAWLSLTDRDDKPAVLRAGIACVLGAPARCGTGAGRAALPSLVRALETRPAPFVLVLDDVHVLRKPGCTAVLAALASRLPAGSQLVLAGRCEPTLPVARWCLQRHVLRIGTADLSMCRVEAGALLRAAGADPAPLDLDVLLKRTEGWPAGLALAGLLVGQVPERDRAIAEFAGDDRLVAGYLRQELLSGMSPDLLRFITRTSVLDRLSGPLCDAVLGRQGSDLVLRQLEESNQFLVPLDRRQEWYRYHHLLGDMLRGELRRQDPELEPELHLRAGAWYETHGNPGEAVRHLRAAGAVGRVAELVRAHLLDELKQGRLHVLAGWLDGLRDTDVAAHPALALAAGWCCLERADGPGAQRWAAAAERGALQGRSPGPGVLRSAALLLRAAAAPDGVTRMGEDAARGCGLEGGWHGLACLLQGVSWRLRGELGRARDCLDACEELSSAPPAPAILAQCLAQAALLAIAGEYWEEAAALALRAGALVERHLLRAHATTIPISAVSALLLARQGQAGDARSLIRRTRQRLEALPHAAPWFAIDARLQLARASLRLGDPATARCLLAQARRLAGRTPDPGVVAVEIEETGLRVDAFWRAGVVAPSPLSRAELRILPLLTTHFSFREIGERLHLSPFTVKSQALSAYRKLEVTSRSEAVERAATLGLIQDGRNGDAGAGERPPRSA
jgi:LuxR family transcriptional regulator, maltose regulon positive regulatory protein